MNNLQYDSLYKFLVSLGIILIILPFIALVYLINGDAVLISQTDYDALSQYSLQILNNRSELFNYFIDHFESIGSISILVGLLFAGTGLYKWKKNQDTLDKKLEAEATVQELSARQMSTSDVLSELEKETTEANPPEEGISAIQSPENKQQSTMAKFAEIEDYCFSYIFKKYSRNYIIQRNIRIQKYNFDVIGISKKDNIDLLFEIKYWRNPSIVFSALSKVCTRMYHAGIEYETETHRNYRCNIIIVTPKTQLPTLEAAIERFLEKKDSAIVSSIHIQCLSEESL